VRRARLEVLDRDDGAIEIHVGQGDVTWVVLADPEGNKFCILRGKS
jgi:hypothetical protein